MLFVCVYSGVEMPIMQLGTAHLITKPGIDATVPRNFSGILPERTYRQVELALQHGIRAFDTALIYRSHDAIGAVLGEWWRTGRLSRRDVWITTKIFHPDARSASFGMSHMPFLSSMTPLQVEELTRQHFETSLLQLGVGYIDLLLLHWPSQLTNRTETVKSDASDADDGSYGTISIHRQRRLAAWRVLEEVYGKGWARAVGVSNFSPQHLQQLQLDGATIRPMVNQFEASVTLQYTDILQYCLQHDIVPQAYSPFGRGLQNLPSELETIARRFDNIAPGQVALQYLRQLGYSIVYLSNSAAHMVSNTRTLSNDNFTLSDSDMELLAALHRPDGGWGLPSPHDLD
jgi:diketogulonate reductase-like aldo/keto reductase